MKFDSARVSLVLQRTLGLLTAAMVIGVYAYAYSRGRMPPSHPWSGITLSLLAARAIFTPVKAGEPPKQAGWVLSGLAILSALAWAWSTHLGR